MSDRYQNLLRPLKVRNTTLKSRFLYPCAQPHFLAGPEKYPSESLTSFYERIAKNGAAVITIHDVANDYQRSVPGFDIPHFAMWDFNDPACQNYFTHFASHLSYYGSILCSSMNVDMEPNVNWSVNPPMSRIDGDPMAGHMDHGVDEYGDEYTFGALVGPEGKAGEMSGLGAQKEPPKPFDHDSIQEYIGIYADRCKKYQSFGFNAGQIEFRGFLGQFFLPDFNRRTDEYGGSLENRLRFSHEFFQGLRRVVGEDYLLVANCPRIGEGGWTEELLIEYLKAVEPYIDILHIRDFSPEMGTREECEGPTPAVDLSARIKASGVKIVTAVNTPYMDLDALEEIIASGKADMISSNHMFMCNNDLHDIMVEGRGEDLEPCLLCHACRGLSWKGNWQSVCTINPVMGMEYREQKMVEPATSSKRVALIGGGPGAMRCALYLADRGHKPVIYEKSGSLGGQVKGSANCDFKWRMDRYLKWLESQLEKKAVPVMLNTEATPEMIRAEGYDVVIAATGAHPKPLPIPGAENASRWNVVNIYGNEAQLGKRVVVVGGASSAAEAAIHLAREGHEVTELTRKNIIAHDLNPIRSRGLYNKYAHRNGVKIEKNVSVDRIEPGRVWFTTLDGEQKCVEFDDAILSGGMEPDRDGAIGFYGSAKEFYMIGDCREANNMRLAIRDAYAVAMQIK